MGRKRKLNGNSRWRPEKPRKRVSPFAAVIALAVVVTACLGFLCLKSRHPGASAATAPTAQVRAASQPAAAVAAGSGFERLKGKWLRPDGGYVIEVRNIGDGGKMDASYFNPRPSTSTKPKRPGTAPPPKYSLSCATRTIPDPLMIWLTTRRRTNLREFTTMPVSGRVSASALSG